MTTQSIHADRLLCTSGNELPSERVTIQIEGDRIADIRSASTDSADGHGLFAMPALANAHDHARGVKPLALGATNEPLEYWLATITGAPRVDPYLAAAAAFGRSALGGAGTVMVHYIRWQGGMSPVDEARAVARAADDVGIRIGFAVSMRDMNALAYADDAQVLPFLDATDHRTITRRLSSPAAPASEQVALVEEIAASIEGGGVTVQLGPTGVQWCSDGLLRAIAEASARSGRRIHMHFLETRYQREWADSHFPQGIAHYLDSIGLLSPRLSLAHAVWARPDELSLLAERGVRVCVNTSSNLLIRSGIAPVRGMLAAGVKFAMGLDGVGIDDDDDALREARLLWLTHQGIGFDAPLDTATLMRAVTEQGRYVVSGIDEPASLEVANLADILVLDYASIAHDSISEELDPLVAVLLRGKRVHVRELYVAGRAVVAKGKLLGIDLDSIETELMAQLRAGAPEFNDWQRTVRRMRGGLKRFYQERMHCC